MGKGADKEDIIPLKGLVIDWNLPSKSSLQDWLRKDNPDVRIREVVELFPKEVFKDLDAIRRNFYRKVQGLIIPAYSLKLLPVDSLPKIQKIIELTREKLEALDQKIEASLNSEYYKKATEYYTEVANKSPKKVSRIAGRFRVLMMPLQVNTVLWEEFLNESMKEELKRIDERYTTQWALFNQDLLFLKDELNREEKNLHQLKDQINNAEKEVAEAYESMTVPLDVAVLKIARKQLEEKVKDLRYQERTLNNRLARLKNDRDESTLFFNRSASWARKQTEETKKAISFDVKRLWISNFEDLVKKGLDAFSFEEEKRDKSLRQIQRQAEETLNRICSLQPRAAIRSRYEKLVSALVNKDKKALEELI